MVHHRFFLKLFFIFSKNIALKYYLISITAFFGTCFNFALQARASLWISFILTVQILLVWPAPILTAPSWLQIPLGLDPNQVM